MCKRSSPRFYAILGQCLYLFSAIHLLNKQFLLFLSINKKHNINILNRFRFGISNTLFDLKEERASEDVKGTSKTGNIVILYLYLNILYIRDSGNGA